jgi:hypothetical protein
VNFYPVTTSGHATSIASISPSISHQSIRLHLQCLRYSLRRRARARRRPPCRGPRPRLAPRHASGTVCAVAPAREPRALSPVCARARACVCVFVCVSFLLGVPGRLCAGSDPRVARL